MPSEWVFPGIFIALFVLIAAGQSWMLVRQRTYSLIPLLGGLLGVVGCLSAPAPALNRLWWVPLVVDVGSVPLAVVCIYHWIRKGPGGAADQR